MRSGERLNLDKFGLIWLNYQSFTIERKFHMADQKLVDMIKRSVEEFNAWQDDRRMENPNAKTDLSKADFSLCKLDGIDFFGANLEDAKLQGASLRSANLVGGSLFGANLMDADLTNAKFGTVCVSGADFTDANLTGVELRATEGLESACFSGATVEPKAQKVILAAVAESMRDPGPKK